ncbi:ribonuclease H-like domain-containing protein [Tanacetum coccineum]
MYSFFANQSSGPQLDHEDLDQLDEFYLEDMDLKWQVAMISMRLNKFYKKTGRRLQFDAKEPVCFDNTKVKCFNYHKTRHFARECRSKGNQESRRRDAGNTGYREKNNGRRPGKQEEPKALVTLDGEGFDWTGHAEDVQENFALMAYSNSGSDTEVTSCLKECVESYAKLKKLYDEQREQLGDASIEIKAKLQALKKEKPSISSTLEKSTFGNEEKIRFMKLNLDEKLIQMSTRDKSGLGYGNQIHEGVLSYEKEVLESVFDSRSSDVEDSHVHDRFCRKLESVPEPVVVEPKVVSQPKVWSDAPIIEEYKSDSDDEYETVKEQNTYSPSPKADKRDWNGLMSKRMAKQVELNKKKGKGTGQGENRPVWNNVQRLNHQNNFVPKALVLLGAKEKTAVSPQQVIIGDPKDISGTKSPNTIWTKHSKNDDPQKALKNKEIVDSGCSRHMTGNKAYLVEYQDYNGGPVAFGGSKGYITSKGKIKTGKLDFEDVCFVKELQHFNLFSVSQMCDKKNKFLFTDTECLVLSPDFKLPNENQVLLRVPRQNNMYSFNLENIVPTGGLACLIAKATVDESNKWHRRLNPRRYLKLLKKKVGFMLCRKSCCNSFRKFGFWLICLLERGQLGQNGFKEIRRMKEVFALVARMKPSGIFLAFAYYMGYKFIKMDVKEAFLYGTIDEEVYVSQPPGFTASTPIETQKPLTKDEEAVDVDSVLSKVSRVSSFDLEAYSDSDYAGANLDRKSTTRGCQFLGRRLISWQCKKQTIVATSTTKAEYIAAANCCGQVLWIQNQMLDYGFNLMNTKIYIDNESTICIVKNPMFHSKIIKIRHHFIRDAYEKKLIQVLKIHTDDNVADLLTKAFEVARFNLLNLNIGMVNL